MHKVGRKLAGIAKTHIRACFVSLCLIVLGGIIGNIVAHFIEADKLPEISDIVSRFYENGRNVEVDKLTLFFESLKEYTFSFLVILVCSFSVWFIPFAFFRLTYEGFCMGISSGILVRLFGMKAFLQTGIWLILKNTLYIPFLVVLAVYSVQSAIINRKKNIRNSQKILRKVIIEIVIVLLMVVLCSLIENFVTSEVILNLI